MHSFPDDADDSEGAEVSADPSRYPNYTREYRPRPLVYRFIALLGLEWQDPIWRASPDVPFKPCGLVVGRCPLGARLSEWAQGSTLYLPLGHPVPLSVFTALDARDPGARRTLDVRPTLPALVPGERIRLRFESASGSPLGPSDLEIAVWGETQH